jgi:hypothetical protein
MAYGWRKNAEGDGKGYAPRIPEGQHAVKIIKLRYGSKDKPVFTAQDGSRQMMIIFADDKGREVSTNVTLSQKAGWVLARLMGAAGVNLAELEADGKGPEDFADPAFAETVLLERTLVIDVKGTGAFPDVTPVRRDPDAPSPTVNTPAKAPPAKAAEPPASVPDDDNTIPF